MIPIKQLEEYCKSRLLKINIEEDLLTVDNEFKFQIVDSEEKLFNENFEFLPKPKYKEIGFVYFFCGRWYTQPYGESEVVLKEFVYVGKPNNSINTETFLGVHSGHELMNGVGTVKKWVEKAKFLGVGSLGIAENKNLSGVLDFQTECLKNGIKPITGITVPVLSNSENYIVKLYAKNFQGWQVLLKANYMLNVEEKKGLDECFIKENLEDIFIIFDTKFTPFKMIPDFAEYYQLDTMQFYDQDLDREYLVNLEKYIKSDLKPVLLNDAYCLEKEEWEVREKLWGVSKVFHYKSRNQYFKSHEESYGELLQLFEDNCTIPKEIFSHSVKNANMIANECNFIYDTTSRHLPKYEMTKEESEKFSSPKELFIHLIHEGLNRKIKGDKKPYIERIKKEVKILDSGDVIDYFLITRSISNFAKSKGVLLGVARGSAGGCLVSYLLDITEIDPLEYGLIFERFLNEGRMGEWCECKAFEIETDEGTITLNEKSLLKVLRNQKELNIFVEDLQDGDKIIKY